MPVVREAQDRATWRVPMRDIEDEEEGERERAMEGTWLDPTALNTTSQ